ncbi:hypothetical protein [Aquabacter cavernae]|uniref:hypothetical protein n=1 Tax=Aquabacter cavernae TaxID=2496029 RepID=UPI00196A3547|nr:hypothetical protein [Aquabacter cavernae]
MPSDDTLRKLALPLALVAAFLASSAANRPGPFQSGASAHVPVLDRETARHWQEAYHVAAPMLQMGN